VRTMVVASRAFADERDRRMITGLVHQFLMTFLGLGSGIVAAILALRVLFTILRGR